MLLELRVIFPILRQGITFSRIFFFRSVIIEWNNLDPNLRNSKSISVFKEKILNFIRPSSNYFFDIHNPKAIKLITRLRLGLSHLRKHKFKHSFQETINPLCNCGQDIESTTHFFPHCSFFINERFTLLSTIRSLDSKLLDCTDYDLTQTLLFGKTSQTSSNNFEIINASIDYILSRKRFDEPLFKINSFISKSEFNQQFSFFQCNFLCLCFLVYILREVKCKFIVIYIYIYIYIYILYIYIYKS